MNDWAMIDRDHQERREEQAIPQETITTERLNTEWKNLHRQVERLRKLMGRCERRMEVIEDRMYDEGIPIPLIDD